MKREDISHNNAEQTVRIAELEQRLKQLAAAKSQLQLYAELINKLSLVKGLDNVPAQIVTLLMGTLGGTNITLFYVIDATWHSIDAMGTKLLMKSVPDPSIEEALVGRKSLFMDVKADTHILPSSSLREFSHGATWIIPLAFEDEVVGAIKMEGMMVVRPDMMDHIQPFINYATMVLKSEVEKFTKLRLAYDDIKRINQALTKEIEERKKNERDKAVLESQLIQAQKMEAVGQLAGGVAHDFNNMLGVILGHAEMAMEHIDPHHPISADLNEIQKAAQRSADITRQLLAFARRQTVAPRVLDLNETIEGMLKMLRRLIGENIDLAWLPGTGLWPVKIDPSQIDQILANLFVNARAAIAGVGKMTVETGNNTFDEEYCDAHAGFVSGEYVRIVVSDNGSGMDKETLAHIFEPFFTTKGVGEGTGLGLATVYGAIKQNYGFINVYSELGIGTRFTIYLPRHVGKEVRVTTVNSAGPAKRGIETILLVEDEPTILAMTKIMLQMLGYTVLTAGTPREAIRMAGEFAKEIHLLVTDVVMPEMNGQDLASTLLPIYPHLKCLFMSGYTSDIIAKHGILAEGIQFIQKPFSKKDLADKVRMVLEKSEQDIHLST